MCETPASIHNLDDYLASLRACAAEASRQLAFLAEFVAAERSEVDPEGEFAVREVAAVSRASPQSVRNRVALAQTLLTRLPQTMAALRQGVIDEHKAGRVAAVTEVLSDELAAEVEQAVIPCAGECDPALLARRLRRTVHRVDPEGAAARAEAKRAMRQVRHDTDDDATGLLTIQGDVEHTQLAYDRITAIARQLKTAGDSRTLDQLRADVALDCLAGKEFKHAKIHVWLTIPATAALGVDQKPGHLAGYGWLPAQRALELAAQENATWQRILTDPATGQVLDVGRNRYRPPAALRDHLRAAYPTCVGPGCRQPAHRCDLDHLVPFPAGPTTSENMRPLCRPHHRTKTLGGWRVITTPDGTGLTWVTKHGYRFPYKPEPIADPENVQARQDKAG